MDVKHMTNEELLQHYSLLFADEMAEELPAGFSNDFRDELLTRMQPSPIVQAMKVDDRLSLLNEDETKLLDWSCGEWRVMEYVSDEVWNTTLKTESQQEAIDALLGGLKCS